MDEKLISELKQIPDRDKVVELLLEARNAIRSEINVVFDKLKSLNKEMTIAVLEEEILCMNCILAMITEYLLNRNKGSKINVEQFEFINKLMHCAKID